MSVAAVILDLAAPARGRRQPSPQQRRRAAPVLATSAARAALEAGFDEVVGVVSAIELAEAFPEEATVLLEQSQLDETALLHAALDWCARAGHQAVVVANLAAGGTTLRAIADPRAWRLLKEPAKQPIAVLVNGAERVGLLRLEAEVWPLVPLEGPIAPLLVARSELVTEVSSGDAGAVQAARTPTTAEEGAGEEWASADDVAAVEVLLGRAPSGRFSVVVRDRAGAPVVIKNAPLLEDGTPMPTRYWLVGRKERELVGRLESTGAVDELESEVDPEELDQAHRRYAAERDAALPVGHSGPVPSGGVGGTRQGVKCLHAHLAWYLAGGADPVGRKVALRLADELEGPVAAIDCGTNSTRLLVADRDGATLAREMTITRLGADVDTTHRLDAAAIERTIEALRSYRRLLDQFGVVRVRASATSAARDAENSAEFFDAAEAVLGVRPQLLSGPEEGRLSYAGATSGLPAGTGPYLVCDLGGGSTELVAGDEHGEVAAIVSLNVGCVRLSERFLSSDPPSPDEVSSARRHVAALIEAALREQPALAAPPAMVGVAGTVSTLVGLRIGLDHYERARLHHQRLRRDDVEALLERLASSSLARRRAMPGIEAGRADVIVGGAIVLAEVMAKTGHDELVYSEDDILDGMVASLLAR